MNDLTESEMFLINYCSMLIGNNTNKFTIKSLASKEEYNYYNDTIASLYHKGYIERGSYTSKIIFTEEGLKLLSLVKSFRRL